MVQRQTRQRRAPPVLIVGRTSLCKNSSIYASVHDLSMSQLGHYIAKKLPGTPRPLDDRTPRRTSATAAFVPERPHLANTAAAARYKSVLQRAPPPALFRTRQPTKKHNHGPARLPARGAHQHEDHLQADGLRVQKVREERKKVPQGRQEGRISASHVGAFTSIRIVSGSDGRGWSVFRF